MLWILLLWTLTVTRQAVVPPVPGALHSHVAYLWGVLWYCWLARSLVPLLSIFAGGAAGDFH